MAIKSTGRTQRRLLWSVMVLGILVTTIGGTGIFAVFTDRATQGTNTVESGARPKAADIQLAVGSLNAGVIDCGQFGDDLALALWTVTDFQPGDSEDRYLCIRNVGASDVSIALTILDLANSDDACTGDEATIDQNCGQGASFGQLGALLSAEIQGYNCEDTSEPLPAEKFDFSYLKANSASYGPTLPADHTGCLRLGVLYPAATAEADVQAAQSDKVSWSFAFDATTAE